MARETYTEAEARPLYEEVERLRKEGKSVTDAAAEVGIGLGAYYYWKNRFQGKNVGSARKQPVSKRSQVKEIPIQDHSAEPIVAIYGLLSSGDLVKLSDLNRRAA